MTDDAEKEWLEARVGAVGFRTDVITRQHRLTADEPESYGGSDAGPTPYEYLLTAARNADALKKDPGRWMPWNYQDALAQDASPPPSNL